MVREAMQPDRSIAEVGRLYDVNQKQLSRWIREYRDGEPPRVFSDGPR